jgi:hypothetical protein
MFGPVERDGVFISLVTLPSALYGCAGILLLLKVRTNIVKGKALAIYFAGASVIGLSVTVLGFVVDSLVNTFFPCKGDNRCGIGYTITLAAFLMWFVQPYIFWHLSKRPTH